MTTSQPRTSDWADVASKASPSITVTRGEVERDEGSFLAERTRPRMWTCGRERRWEVIRRANFSAEAGDADGKGVLR